jgi:WD40 repeat protein
MRTNKNSVNKSVNRNGYRFYRIGSSGMSRCRKLLLTAAVIISLSLMLATTTIPPTAVAQSPKGQFVQKKNSTADTKKLEMVIQNGHSLPVTCVAYRPDGRIIASGAADKTVCLWTNEGVLLRKLLGHDGFIDCLVFSPDGMLLATASSDNKIRIWNREGVLLHTLVGHMDRIKSIAFTPNGRILASGSSDGTVRFWSRDGEFLRSITDYSSGMAFSPDGQCFAVGSAKAVRIFSNDGIFLRTLTQLKNPISCIAYSPNGQKIVIGSRDSSVHLLDLNGSLLRTFNGHTNSADFIVFSPDGQSIAIASGDGRVRLWSLEGSLMRTFLMSPDVLSYYGIIDFSPDNNTIVMGYSNNIRCINKVGYIVKTFVNNTDLVSSVAFSRDGQKIAISSYGLFDKNYDGKVDIWLSGGSLFRSIAGKTGYNIKTVVFSPDGKTIVTGSDDRKVRVWDCEGQSLHVLDGIESGLIDESSGYGVESIVFSLMEK